MVALLNGSVIKMKLFIKEDDDLKAKLVIDNYDVTFLTMRNGWQWTGMSMTPKLAKLSIKVLQEYLNNHSIKSD